MATPFDCVEVRFKTAEKNFTAIPKLTLSMGDIVATVASPGHDIGIVTLTGELVRIQMKKKSQSFEAMKFLKFIEKLLKDIDIWSTARLIKSL
jgi:hypothetical protein